MTRLVRRRGGSTPLQRGFTLLEVMLALGLLIGGLTVLLLGTGANIARSHNAYLMGVAADLARGKVWDLEETLLHDGFQDTDQEDEGTFEKEGWPKISWESKIERIELPNLETMGGLSEGREAEGKDGKSSSGGGGVMDTLSAMGGGGSEGAQEAGAMAAYFPLFKSLLEKSIRRITLTVRWKVGNQKEKIVIQIYITDPAGVTRAVLGGGTGGGTDSSTNPPPPR